MIEWINNSRTTKCWSCDGKGCKACQKTGKWKEDNYILITNTKDKKQKIAFQVDFIGK